MTDSETALAVRLVIDAHPQGTEAGPKAILDILQALDERFRGMGIQKFKRIYSKAKELAVSPAAAPADYVALVAAAQQRLRPKESAEEPGKSAGYNCSKAEVASALNANKENCESVRAPEVVLTRPDLSRKFGMMFGVDPAPNGGHAITSIRAGGVLEDWNGKNVSMAINTGDILVSVNGRSTFDEMMGEFGKSLSCTLRLRRGGQDCNTQEAKAAIIKEDSSEAAKEAAAWESRKARVTAALIPGLKKIVDSEFGPGAAARIARVEHMYERIGRNEVFEQDDELGKIYAPGYMEGLKPVSPWHNPQHYSWCAELSSQWKKIRDELRKCLDEKMWTAGAYQASNAAYGNDWKIMGVFTADQWRDENKFKVTNAAVRNLKGVKPFEVFFAKMPAHTKIAPHSDNLNYILTSHLALELEEGSCLFKVGNEERAWKEGEMLIADTSYIHSCVNQSERDRYVLVFRFWHPELSAEEHRALVLSHSILAKASGKQ